MFPNSFGLTSLCLALAKYEYPCTIFFSWSNFPFFLEKQGLLRLVLRDIISVQHLFYSQPSAYNSHNKYDTENTCGFQIQFLLLQWKRSLSGLFSFQTSRTWGGELVCCASCEGSLPMVGTGVSSGPTAVFRCFSVRTLWRAVKTHITGWLPQAWDLHLPCKQIASVSLCLFILGGVTSAVGLEERLKTEREQWWMD